MKLGDALRAVFDGRCLRREQARQVFADALSADVDAVKLSGLLGALALRGETPDEIAGAADALRAAMTPFEHDAPDAIDTCGTGGDGLGSFNVSTAAAVVACAAGARVIKHGNRSVSSRCGSADLLEAAGLPLELSPEAAGEVFRAEGITFLFAPRYHPAMRFAAPVRKALGVRTIFNLLGPLCNPGRVRRQLLGVGDREYLEAFAHVMGELGHDRGYVVHGAGGADELTLAGANHVAAVGTAPEAELDASALGLRAAAVSALAGGDARENLRILHAVLRGEAGAVLDAVLLNAAAALVVAGRTDDTHDALARAREAVASGAAKAKLESWVARARRVGGSA